MFSFDRLTAHLWVAQSEVYATNGGAFIINGQACLFDPGLRPAELRRWHTFLARRSATPALIVLTHAHWDHILGPELFPGVPVATSRRFLTTLREHGADLQRQIAAWERVEGRHRDQPFTLPRPDVVFEPPWRCEMNGLSWTALPAPGHTPDQCAFYQPEEKILWAADMLSDREIPLVSDRLSDYEETLARLASLDVRVLVPGHGVPTADPAEIARRFESDRAYLRSLRACVSQAVARGADVEETHTVCDSLSYRYPRLNRQAHHWNVASVFLELGGTASGVIGWAREWLVT